MTKHLRDKTRRCFVSSARRSQSNDGRLLLFVLLVFPGLFTGLLTVLYFGSDQQTAVFNAVEDIVSDVDGRLVGAPEGLEGGTGQVRGQHHVVQLVILAVLRQGLGGEDIETGSGDLLVGKDIGYPELEEVACYYMTAK